MPTARKNDPEEGQLTPRPSGRKELGGSRN